MFKSLFAGVVLLLPTVVLAAAPPAPFEADYQVLRNDQAIGVGHIRLARGAGGGFEMSTRSEGTEGLAAVAGVRREESSRLRWTGEGLELVGYRMQQKAAWNSRELVLEATPGGQAVRATWKGETTTFPGTPGLLDKQAVTAALMSALAAGERGTVEFAVADRNGVETQRYRVAAAVRLRTALGTRRALRVERVREGDSGRITKIWFDRENGWLPLRIKQYESDGETLDLRITAVR